MKWEVTIKPSDVYIDQYPRKRIQDLLKRNNSIINNFRPTLPGDTYISNDFRIVSTVSAGDLNAPRFIIVSLPEPVYFPEWE